MMIGAIGFPSPARKIADLFFATALGSVLSFEYHPADETPYWLVERVAGDVVVGIIASNSPKRTYQIARSAVRRHKRDAAQYAERLAFPFGRGSHAGWCPAGPRRCSDA